MKLEQPGMVRWDNKDIMIELTLQTREAFSHKIITESNELITYIKRCMRDCNGDILTMMKHEFDVKYPDGLK